MEYVKLKRIDLDVITDICQEMVTYKYHALSRTNWSVFERTYLPSLLLQLNRNQFKIVTASNNIMVWIIDQIVNSRVYVEGVRIRDMMPLADTGLGEQALRILRAAKNGQESYDRYCSPNEFTNLFD